MSEFKDVIEILVRVLERIEKKLDNLILKIKPKKRKGARNAKANDLTRARYRTKPRGR